MANVEDRQSCHQKAALLQLHLAVLGAHYHELDIALPTAGSKTGRTIERAGTQGKEIKRDQLKSQSEQASE
jgi:hypothetical protein